MPPAKRSSDILLAMLNDHSEKGDLTCRRILQLLQNRALGIAILLFALPSALPISSIPGISLFFGLIIFLLAIQLVMGRKTLWLPEKLENRVIHHTTLSKIITESTPYLKRIEFLLKPRLLVMTNRFMEIINGIIIILLSLLLMLPIPFSNLPLSLLIIIFSLGLIERDGFFILAGYFGSIVYISFVYMIIISILKAIF